MEDDGHTSAHISLNEELQSKSEKKSPEKSNNYSDDFSAEIGKKKEDLVSDSDSTTPEIVLKDNSLDIFGAKKNNRTNNIEREKGKDNSQRDCFTLINVCT